MHGKAADLFLPAVQPCDPAARPDDPAAQPDDPGRALVVGLVNNSVGSAVAVAGRQFRELVARAAGDRRVVLREGTLPGFAASDLAGLDALIVTGAEPGADELPDEPFWPALASLVDRVAATRMPCLFSCLAAHAAVLRLDGIRRVTLDRKAFGVFEQTPTGRHPLLRGLPRSFPLPHSRWNGLPEADLLDAGYRVLTRSHDGSVDMFARPGWPAVLFLQSHPEYDERTLPAQYRRDAKRFLDGRRPNRPVAPVGVPDDAGAATLARWANIASLLLSNWLDTVALHRSDCVALRRNGT